MVKKTSTTKTTGVKYPRVLVSRARHNQLAAEAKKQGVAIAQLVEPLLAKKYGKV